jgi:hypothetical protein
MKKNENFIDSDQFGRKQTDTNNASEKGKRLNFKKSISTTLSSIVVSVRNLV